MATVVHHASTSDRSRPGPRLASSAPIVGAVTARGAAFWHLSGSDPRTR